MNDRALAQKLEDTGHSTTDAAQIVGISAADLRNWMDRYGLFREKRGGAGSYLRFRLTDLFKLAAIKALVSEGGLAPREAVDAVNPFSPYGSFLHDSPQVFTLTKRGERWQAAWSTESIVLLELKLLPLWNSFKGRLATHVGDESIEAFDRAIEESRAGK